MNNELIAFKDTKSPISEIFRTLRTNIQFMNSNSDSKAILITSTYAGEGKSWVSANLAVSFAQNGDKVLLIDADMRKGRQYVIFKTAPKPGLSNYLSGYYENKKTAKKINNFIQDTEIENLYIMPAGNMPPNPSELLNTQDMIELLKKVKKDYDIIILDGTPTQLVADSLILTRIVDSTILITACKETKKDELKKIVKNIENVGGKIFGVVLNKVPVSTKKYMKRYYYSSNLETRDETNEKEEKNNKTINNKTKKKSSKLKDEKYNENTGNNIEDILKFDNRKNSKKNVNNNINMKKEKSKKREKSSSDKFEILDGNKKDKIDSDKENKSNVN